ncbi:hypothetical protein AB0L85_20485 [Streptomyces sp. NPDC052051]|uniref:hypothetical protein n=1 Tax=Streptomyces sp. NPDC052051 TaxID=3154649 RepID=UPI00343EAA95
MSPAPQHPRRTAQRHAWLRVLLVLGALLFAAGAPAEAAGGERIAPSTTQTCDAEHDVLTTLRPASLPGHRALAPLRPRPRPRAWPSAPDRLLPGPVSPPYSGALYALRTVVLLC